MIPVKRQGLDPESGYAMLAGAIVLGLLGAMTAGTLVNRRSRPAFVRIDVDLG